MEVFIQIEKEGARYHCHIIICHEWVCKVSILLLDMSENIHSFPNCLRLSQERHVGIDKGHWKPERTKHPCDVTETHHSMSKDLAKKSPPGVHPSLGTAGSTAGLCRGSNCSDTEQNGDWQPLNPQSTWYNHPTQEGQGIVEVQLQEFLKPLSLSHIFMQQQPFTLITCRLQYPLQHSLTLVSSKNMKVDVLKVKMVFCFMHKRCRILIRTFKTP